MPGPAATHAGWLLPLAQRQLSARQENPFAPWNWRKGDSSAAFCNIAPPATPRRARREHAHTHARTHAAGRGRKGGTCEKVVSTADMSVAIEVGSVPVIAELPLRRVASIVEARRANESVAHAGTHGSVARTRSAATVPDTPASVSVAE